MDQNKAKPFIKSVVVGATGLDVSFSEETKAMKFVSHGGCHTGNALRKSFGTFYPVEIASGVLMYHGRLYRKSR